MKQMPSGQEEDVQDDDDDDVFDYSHQLDPAHGTSSSLVATFNLVATIVGGGVLSLPYALSQIGGAAWGIAAMIVAAMATDASCWMLCWCARPAIDNGNDNDSDLTRHLLSSYGQVGRAAFGPILEVAISALLFVFLIFVLIGYLVLIKDIWTPLVVDRLLQFDDKNNVDDYKSYGPWVLLSLVLLMSPFLVQKTLHSLRFNCYIGFGSVTILCGALCRQAWQHGYDILSSPSFWFAAPPSWSGLLTALPIVMLSYLCHFNVNAIQKALHRPTVPRVQRVLTSAMGACGTLMTVFGVAGYAAVLGMGQTVQGNILLNVEQTDNDNSDDNDHDVFMELGRVGCGTTILLAMAMMILPCRDSLLEVLDILLLHHHHHRSEKTKQQQQQLQQNKSVQEGTPLLTVSTTATSPQYHHHHEPPQSLSTRPVVHYTSTLLIVTTCYIFAIEVPGVQVVWSLCGSSMAFGIAFILPSACALQLLSQRQRQLHEQSVAQQSQSHSIRSFSAWSMLVLSVIAAVVCTTQTLQSLWVVPPQ